jgi:hypothetical protein
MKQLNMNKLTPSQRAAANLPDLNAIATREATDKATGKLLQGIASDLLAVVSVKVSSLQDVIKKLEAANQPSKVEALTLAAARLTADPLDFDAIRMVKLVIDGLTEAAGMLGSYSTSTETTPGAVIPPAPVRPDDYAKSMHRYEEQWVAHERRREDAMHPIAAIASRNGSR